MLSIIIYHLNMNFPNSVDKPELLQAISQGFPFDRSIDRFNPPCKYAKTKEKYLNV